MVYSPFLWFFPPLWVFGVDWRVWNFAAMLVMSLFTVVLLRGFGTQWEAVVRAFLEYVAIDSLTLLSAPGPFGDRGGMLLMATWG